MLALVQCMWFILTRQVSRKEDTFGPLQVPCITVLICFLACRWLAQLLVNLGHPHNDPLFLRDIHEPTVLQA